MNNSLDNAIAVLKTHQNALHGPLGDVSPLAKILTACAYLVLAVSFRMHDLVGTVVFATLPFAFAAICRISPLFLLKRAALALPFILFAGLANCWYDRTAVAVLPGMALPGGIVALLTMICKTLGTVATIALLSATTSISDISKALSSLHVPCIIVLQIQLLFRYLLLSFEEARTVTTAYHLRAPFSKKIPLRNWGAIIARSFLRAAQRGDTIYLAMQCRLFDARRPLPKAKRPTPREWLATILSIAALCGLRFFL